MRNFASVKYAINTEGCDLHVEMSQRRIHLRIHIHGKVIGFRDDSCKGWLCPVSSCSLHTNDEYCSMVLAHKVVT